MGWEWDGQWTVETSGHADKHGWAHAGSWPALAYPFSAECGVRRPTDLVRRRRYVRRRVRRATEGQGSQVRRRWRGGGVGVGGLRRGGRQQWLPGRRGAAAAGAADGRWVRTAGGCGRSWVQTAGGCGVAGFWWRDWIPPPPARCDRAGTGRRAGRRRAAGRYAECHMVL